MTSCTANEGIKHTWSRERKVSGSRARCTRCGLNSDGPYWQRVYFRDGESVDSLYAGPCEVPRQAPTASECEECGGVGCSGCTGQRNPMGTVAS